jgi:hypothetical protein
MNTAPKKPMRASSTPNKTSNRIGERISKMRMAIGFARGPGKYHRAACTILQALAICYSSFDDRWSTWRFFAIAERPVSV